MAFTIAESLFGSSFANKVNNFSTSLLPKGIREKVIAYDNKNKQTRLNDIPSVFDNTMKALKYNSELQQGAKAAERIEDKTAENIIQDVQTKPIWLQLYEMETKRQDEKQKHIEEREDTAYQRSTADAWAAGINPNLVNIEPAASGGGLYEVTANTSMDETLLNNAYEMLMQEIDQQFEGNENAKERIHELILNLLKIQGLKETSAINSAGKLLSGG